ncbi:sister chromatid cohesion protein 1 [Polyrhizophydium stewartii]|uniref:Sister chromatid cohesion protein 1 n=1 Tax=Polyrhizophydium stewartii TaxID=2732419 RepID=A0ABR4N455_9FUNG
MYLDTILGKKGPLAKVWLAAHWERKLSKSQFLQTNIRASVGAIMGTGGETMALRLTGQLLLGVVRIYSRKTRYLLEDCNEALIKIKMAFRPGMVDMTDEQAVATAHTITLPDAMAEFDILLPEPRIDLMSLLSQPTGAAQNVSRLQDITLVETSMFSASQREDLLADPIGMDAEDAVETGLDGGPLLDLRFGDEPSAMEIEVGRDAAPARGFSPERGLGDESMLGAKGAPVDTSAGQVSGDASISIPDITVGSAADGGNLEPHAADDPLMYVGDDNFDFGFGQPLDLAIPTDAAGNQENEPDEDGVFKAPERLVGKRGGAEGETTPRKRAATQQRRRRLAIDDEIDLHDRQLMQHLQNTADIRQQQRFVPASRMHSAWSEIMSLSARSYTSRAIHEELPAELDLLFRPTDAVRRFEFAPSGNVLGDLDVAGGRTPLPHHEDEIAPAQLGFDYDNFDPYLGMDMPETMAPLGAATAAEAERAALDGQAEAARATPPFDPAAPGDEIQQVDAGDVTPRTARSGARSSRQPGERLAPILDDAADAQERSLADETLPADESILLGVGAQSYAEISVDDDHGGAGAVVRGSRLAHATATAAVPQNKLYEFDDSAEPTQENEAGLSKHTYRTIRILQDRFEGGETFGIQGDSPSERAPAKYSEFVQGAPRSARARFFFELLVLKTKKMIDVQQKKPYDDISIVPTPNLFEALA